MKRLNRQKAKCRWPVIPGPVWTDHCKHGKECYVCSFAYAPTPTQQRKYDLYIFKDKLFGEEVCIRYGEEPHLYLSSGAIGQFLISSGCFHSPEHKIAAQILSEGGTLTWKPRGAK